MNISEATSEMRYSRALLQAVIGFLILAGIIRLFRAAEIDSQDFHVYWKTALAWFKGDFPYQILPSDHGFVFKYPPWLIPVFAPLGWLGFEFSKGVWAMLELLAIGYSCQWLRKQGLRQGTTLAMVALFWYLWLAHLFAGQVTIFLLITALWAFSSPPGRGRDIKYSLLGVLFTAKVFSTYSLAGCWRNLARWRVIQWGVAFFVLMNIVLLLKITHDSSGSPLWHSWLELYSGWIRAAGSGGSELGAEVVRGTGNHGFVAAILRWVDPAAQNLRLDLATSLGLALALGWLWNRLSRTLPPAQAWTGWLAYGVIVHPLAWHHSFVLTFPFCAFALEEALGSKKKSNLALVLLGIALIGLMVPQVVGKTIVKPFELLGNKSWGVVLCAIALLRSRKSSLIHAKPLAEL